MADPALVTASADPAAGWRWQRTPLALLIGGVALSWTAAGVGFFAPSAWLSLLVLLGGGMALSAALWLRRRLSQAETEREAHRAALAAEQTLIRDQRSQFETLRKQIETELSAQAGQLQQRQQSLAQRLSAYHEWMEFPQPVDLADPAPSDSQLAELVRKDRALNDLLKDETRRLYDKLVSNHYAPGGKVNPLLIRDDLLDFLGRAARVYRPEIRDPLAEVSLHNALKAVSRVGLHFLVVLDELPLGVKDYSLDRLYGYVRTAVVAYRMYKTTEPYWPYVNTAYYLSRVAMGANPLTLGAWWFLGTLSRQGASALAQQVMNRQALTLLSDLVRVLGYEAAHVYGGDFRRRDANWVYAAELTELLTQFPLSRDGLAAALKELGALQLRSEYDRVFFYRAVAARVSARAQQLNIQAVLTLEERRAIASRLEKFLELHLHGRSNERVQRWLTTLEERLGVPLKRPAKPAHHSVREQLAEGLRSLASFVVAVKECEPHDLSAKLAHSRLLAELPAAAREELLAELTNDPPYFFEHADIDPDSDLVGIYLDDLALLQATIAPHDAALEQTLLDAAAYLRREPKQMHALLEKQYAAELARRLHPDAPLRKAPAGVARAALDLLAGESAALLYGGVVLELGDHPSPEEREAAREAHWLVATSDTLLVFSAGERPRLWWRGKRGSVTVEQQRTMLASACKLAGGEWAPNPSLGGAVWKIATPLMHSWGVYFRPLQQWIELPQRR